MTGGGGGRAGLGTRLGIGSRTRRGVQSVTWPASIILQHTSITFWGGGGTKPLLLESTDSRRESDTIQMNEYLHHKMFLERNRINAGRQRRKTDKHAERQAVTLTYFPFDSGHQTWRNRRERSLDDLEDKL